MRAKIAIAFLSISLLTSFGLASNQAFGHGSVDQSQEDFDDNRFPVADWSQSFIPTKDNLIGVDLFFDGPSGGCPCSESYKLEIREGTFGGTVVGTSGTEQIDFAGNSEDEEVHFHFPVTVPLTPGTTYFTKIILTDGPGFYDIVVVDGNAYDDGVAHEQGVEKFEDLFFRTYFEEPEPPVVGGEFLPIDSTALVLAGLQTSAIWMLPVLAGVAGSAFGILYIKSRRN